MQIRGNGTVCTAGMSPGLPGLLLQEAEKVSPNCDPLDPPLGLSQSHAVGGIASSVHQCQLGLMGRRTSLMDGLTLGTTILATVHHCPGAWGSSFSVFLLPAPSSAWICFSLFECFPNRPLSDICFLEKLTWHRPERFTELATHGALLLGSISRDHIPLWEIQEPSCCPVYLEVKEEFYYSFIFYFCSMCVCVCTRVHKGTAACVWNQENSLQQSFLSLRYAGSGDQTQIAQVGTESSHQPSDHIFKTFTTKKKWGQEVFRLIQNQITN